MPTMNREAPPITPSVLRHFRVIFQSPDPNGWAVATIDNSERESVGICWNTPARAGRARFLKAEDWFILPPEIAQDVLLRAKELRVQQRLEMSRSYEEQAADVDGEAEALEWCEALIGDAYAPDAEEG